MKKVFFGILSLIVVFQMSAMSALAVTAVPETPQKEGVDLRINNVEAYYYTGKYSGENMLSAYVVVENTGTKVSPEVGIFIGWYSQDGDALNKYNQNSYYTLPTLDPGEVKKVSFLSLWVPSSADALSQLKVTVDYYNEVEEVDEDNNVYVYNLSEKDFAESFAFDTDVVATSDIGLADGLSIDTSKPDVMVESITFVDNEPLVTVRNIGNKGMSSEIYVKYTLIAQDGTALFSDEWAMGTLKAGEVSNHPLESVKWLLEEKFKEARWFKVELDHTQKINESNEVNNSKIVIIDKKDFVGADLTIGSIDFVDGTPQVKIKNIGDNLAKATTLRYTWIAQDGTVLEQGIEDIIYMSAGKEITMPIFNPGPITENARWFKVELDYAHKVDESDETNNSMVVFTNQKTITGADMALASEDLITKNIALDVAKQKENPFGFADMIVKQITFAEQGEPIVTLKNIGLESAPASMINIVFINAEGKAVWNMFEVGTDGWNLGNIAGMDPNEEMVVSYEGMIFPSEDVKWVKVIVDAYDQVEESNEKNNQLVAIIPTVDTNGIIPSVVTRFEMRELQSYEPRVLPGNIIYWIKDIGRDIRVLATRDEQKRALLHLRYAGERFVETQKLIQQGKADTASKYLKEYTKELKKINEIADSLDVKDVEKADSIREQTFRTAIKHQTILARLEHKTSSQYVNRVIKDEETIQSEIALSLENINDNILRRHIIDKAFEHEETLPLSSIRELEALEEVKQRIQDDTIQEEIRQRQSRMAYRIAQDVEDIEDVRGEDGVAKENVVATYTREVVGNEVMFTQALSLLDSIVLKEHVQASLNETKATLLKRLEERSQDVREKDPQTADTLFDGLRDGRIENQKTKTQIEQLFRPILREVKQIPDEVVPSDCIEDTWECGDWSKECMNDGTQMRECKLTLDCPEVVSEKPETKKVCSASDGIPENIEIKNNTESQERTGQERIDNEVHTERVTVTDDCDVDFWSCGEWSVCNNDTQTRSCKLTYDCPNSEASSPNTQQNCTISRVDEPKEQRTEQPSCSMDDWECGEWTSCVNSKQTRACKITKDGCDELLVLSPTTEQECEMPKVEDACHEDVWSCSDWSNCGQNGEQRRVCDMTDDCRGVDTAKPVETQSCTPPVVGEADLSVTNVVHSSSERIIHVGDILSFSAEVVNSGNGNAGESYSLLYVNDSFIKSFSHTSFTPGQTQTATFSNIYTPKVATTFEYKICADMTYNVEESNENNNCTSKAFTVVE